MYIIKTELLLYEIIYWVEWSGYMFGIEEWNSSGIEPSKLGGGAHPK